VNKGFSTFQTAIWSANIHPFFENGLKKILGLFAANIAGTDIGNGCAPDTVAYPNGKSPATTQCGTQSAVGNELTKLLKGEL